MAFLKSYLILWIPFSIDFTSSKNFNTVISSPAGWGVISTILCYYYEYCVVTTLALELPFFVNNMIFLLRNYIEFLEFQNFYQCRRFFKSWYFQMETKDIASEQEIKSIRFALCAGWQYNNQVSFLKNFVGQHNPSIQRKIVFQEYVDTSERAVSSCFWRVICRNSILLYALHCILSF